MRGLRNSKIYQNLPIFQLISVPFALTKIVKSQLLIYDKKPPYPCPRVWCVPVSIENETALPSWEGLEVG